MKKRSSKIFIGFLLVLQPKKRPSDLKYYYQVTGFSAISSFFCHLIPFKKENNNKYKKAPKTLQALTKKQYFLFFTYSYWKFMSFHCNSEQLWQLPSPPLGQFHHQPAGRLQLLKRAFDWYTAVGIHLICRMTVPLKTR